MEEIIDQYAPILEGKVNVADVKKKQKQLRLNGKRNERAKSQPLPPLKKINAESESKNKHPSAKNKSLPQNTNDLDSTS